MALPANVDTGKVEGRFVVGVIDGPDPDDEPDAIPAQGTITFTASVPYLPNPSASTTILKAPIVAVLDDEGWLCVRLPDGTAGARGVRLIATDDEDLSVTGWTWTVTYAFENVNGVRPQIAAHSMALPSGTTIDLTSVVKVPSSTGIGVEQAEALAATASAAARDAAAAAALAAEAAQPTDNGVATLVAYGGQTTTALDRGYRRSVSTAEHGATGDGIADDTAAIQSAVDAGAGSRLPTVVPAGTYRLTATLNLPAGTDLRFDPGARIDVSDVSPSVPAISAKGASGSPVSLTADASEGDRAIAVADATGIVAGSWVKIASTRPFGYTGQPAGEIQQVASVGGGTVTLGQALADAYTVADSATVTPVTFCEDVHITGGTMVGIPDSPTTTHRGVVFELVRNAAVTGMSFRWVHYVGIWLRDTVGASITGCGFDDALLAGMGYGVMMTEATQDVAVTACRGTRTRHAVTFGGGARPGIVRRVTVTGCTFSQCLDAGLDAHPGAEEIVFSGNVISGSLADGIVMQGGAFTISDNIVSASDGHGILVQNLTRKGLGGSVSGNRVSRSGGAGVYVGINTDPAYRAWSGLAITGNTISDGTSSGISVFNSDPSFKVEGVAVTGNTLRRHASHSLYLRGVENVTVSANHIAGTTGPNESVYLHECADVAVSGNSTRGGVRSIRSRASTGVTVTGNRGTGATHGVLSDAVSGPLVVMGNNFAGCTTPLSLASAGNVSTTADAAGAYNL